VHRFDPLLLGARLVRVWARAEVRDRAEVGVGDRDRARARARARLLLGTRLLRGKLFGGGAGELEAQPVQPLLTLLPLLGQSALERTDHRLGLESGLGHHTLRLR